MHENAFLEALISVALVTLVLLQSDSAGGSTVEVRLVRFVWADAIGCPSNTV